MGDTTARVAALTMDTIDAAQRLGVSVDFVQERVRSGEWPCTRMGRKLRFTEADLADILRICRSEPVTRSTRRRSA